ncbi:MAG: hypothetical protein Tsb009_17330 [Planctomycetaceae bacterium]
MSLRARSNHSFGRTMFKAMLAIFVMAAGSHLANCADRSSSRKNSRPFKRGTKPENKVTIIRKGTSSKKSRQSAQSLIAKTNLRPNVRKRVDQILKETSLYRELPSVRFEIDPKVYLYFAAHPDVAVSVWRAMGISKFQLKENRPAIYSADGGDGTRGQIEVVHRGPGHILVTCDGVYKNPWLLKPVKTRSLIHLQASFQRDQQGRIFVTHRAFLHVAFPSMAVETTARLLSPISHMILDQNFQEISLFLHVMSRAMARQPGWVERIAGSLDGVERKRRKEMLDLTAQVYVNANKRPKPSIRKFNTTNKRTVLNGSVENLKKNASRPMSVNRSTRVQTIRPAAGMMSIP